MVAYYWEKRRDDRFTMVFCRWNEEERKREGSVGIATYTYWMIIILMSVLASEIEATGRVWSARGNKLRKDTKNCLRSIDTIHEREPIKIKLKLSRKINFNNYAKNLWVIIGTGVILKNKCRVLSARGAFFWTPLYIRRPLYTIYRNREEASSNDLAGR